MPNTHQRYVTAYNYADNSPSYSDFVSRGRRRGGGGAPPHDYRADIGRNDFDNPSSIAVGPEAQLESGSLVFIEGYGWFMVEDRTDIGLSHAPRFDMWTAGATAVELHALTGFFDVTVFDRNETVPGEWRNRVASASWDWERWVSEGRLAAFRPRHSWHGLYVEGGLIL
jgi:hypothetical protein